MTLKEKFLKIKTAGEYQENYEEFKNLIDDDEIRIHRNEIFNQIPQDSVIVELYKEPRKK